MWTLLLKVMILALPSVHDGNNGVGGRMSVADEVGREGDGSTSVAAGIAVENEVVGNRVLEIAVVEDDSIIPFGKNKIE